jgi:glyceraldehyde 3-phosphate dehydrogenase
MVPDKNNIPYGFNKYLSPLRYDSTHVGLHRDSTVQVSIVDGKLCVNEQKIAVFSERDPKNIPWGASGKLVF